MSGRRVLVGCAGGLVAGVPEPLLSLLVWKKDTKDDIPRWARALRSGKSTNNRPFGTLLIGCAGPRTSIPLQRIASEAPAQPAFQGKKHQHDDPGVERWAVTWTAMCTVRGG